MNTSKDVTKGKQFLEHKFNDPSQRFLLQLSAWIILYPKTLVPIESIVTWVLDIRIKQIYLLSAKSFPKNPHIIHL